MSYTVNNTRGTVVSTVNNGTTASVGGITLIGKNYTGYGELIAEDFIKILENNANSSNPASPLEGQLWFDTTNQSLKVYNSSTNWHPITVHVGSAYPHTATQGGLWYNTTTGQLNVNYNGSGTGWAQVSTETEKTRTQIVTLTATQVDDATANKNGYSASSVIEVIAKVLVAGDGTTKEVVQVISPAHFSFANPNNAGSVAQAIYDGYTANITVSASTNSTQGTLIRGINVKDNLLTEGVDADTLNGLTAAQIQASGSTFTIITSNTTATEGANLGVNTTSSTVTVTLPTSGGLTAGSVITLVDSHHKWGTNSCIINPNGASIDGSSSNRTISENAQQLSLMWNGIEWRTFNTLAIYG